MLVKIRLRSGPNVQQKRRKNQHVALAVASLLTPVAVVAYVLVGWKLAAELSLTGEFPFTDGLFSHWQVWMAAAAILHLVAMMLNRYGKAVPIVEKTPVVQKTISERESNLANTRFYF